MHPSAALDSRGGQRLDRSVLGGVAVTLERRRQVRQGAAPRLGHLAGARAHAHDDARLAPLGPPPRLGSDARVLHRQRRRHHQYLGRGRGELGPTTGPWQCRVQSGCVRRRRRSSDVRRGVWLRGRALYAAGASQRLRRLCLRRHLCRPAAARPRDARQRERPCRHPNCGLAGLGERELHQPLKVFHCSYDQCTPARKRGMEMP